MPFRCDEAHAYAPPRKAKSGNPSLDNVRSGAGNSRSVPAGPYGFRFLPFGIPIDARMIAARCFLCDGMSTIGAK